MVSGTRCYAHIIAPIKNPPTHHHSFFRKLPPLSYKSKAPFINKVYFIIKWKFSINEKTKFARRSRKIDHLLRLIPNCWRIHSNVPSRDTLFTFSFPWKGVIYHDESALVALTLWATFRIFFQTVDRVLQYVKRVTLFLLTFISRIPCFYDVSISFPRNRTALQ